MATPSIKRSGKRVGPKKHRIVDHDRTAHHRGVADTGREARLLGQRVSATGD